MAKSTQITFYKLFNSLLFLILTIASCYFVYRIIKFIDSIQTLAAINSESLHNVLTNIANITNKESSDNKQLLENLKKALENIATFKLSLWS